MNRVIQTSYIIEESPYDSKQRQEKFLQKLRHIANSLPNGLSIPTDLESYSSVYIAALLGELETCKRLLREDFVSSSERPVDFFNPSTLRELNTSRLHKSFVTSLLFFGICSSNYELTNWLFGIFKNYFKIKQEKQ